MKRLQLVTLAAALLIAPSLHAQAKKKVPLAKAKVSVAEATKTALALVPGGTVKSHELEREGGKLIYSFDIATKGKSGIDEVQVDAMTGAVVGGIEHEDPATEKKEAKAEAKEKTATAKKKP